mgnify:CR=1 FL=1
MSAMDRAVFNYRCPRCHRIVEKELLFSVGCPLCGWTTPLVKCSGDAKRSQELHRVRDDMGTPMPEVFDEKERVVVLAELQGFTKEEIEVKALNRLLIISAHGLTQRYYRRVMLPCSTMGKAQTKYKNGVLEVVLRKGFYGR